MDRFKKITKRFKKGIHYITDRKHYVDVIIALLSVPALVTALILNINSLQTKKASSTATPTVVVQSSPQVVVPTEAVRIVTQAASPLPTSGPSCTPGIGQLTIAYPQELQTVSDNPLCIELDYDAQNNCQVVWRYRINGGSWTNYGNDSACMYSLPSGQNTFDLQVKSLSSQNMESYTRHFIYQGAVAPTLTPAPVGSSSATTP